MKGYYPLVTKALQEHGYRLMPGRGKGSHEVWTNGSRSQIVPRHLASRHLANDILKQAGIEKRF